MYRYIARRLLQAIPNLFGISILSFVLIQSAPGDFVSLATFHPTVTAEAREKFRALLGQDQPMAIQYIQWLTGFAFRSGDVRKQQAPVSNYCRYLDFVRITACDQGGGLLRWELGRSLTTQEPVWTRLRERMIPTLELGAISLVASFALGVPLGFLAAFFRGSVPDQIIRLLTVAGQAIPTFWLAIICIFLFSVVWGILPVGGRMTLSLDSSFDFVDRVRHLILPGSILALGGLAFITKLMRTQVLEVLSQDFLRTAKAKGIRSHTIWIQHVLRNALMPLATVLGPSIFGIIGGALVLESIFAWPGMGRLTYFAAIQRDYPTIMGAVMFFSLLTILGYLLSDILYAIVDPRIRL